MSVILIRKRFEFALAKQYSQSQINALSSFLNTDLSYLKNPQGRNFEMWLSLTGPLNPAGMVMELADVKTMVQDWLLANCDHWALDLSHLETQSVEKISEYIFSEMTAIFLKMGVSVLSCQLRELEGVGAFKSAESLSQILSFSPGQSRFLPLIWSDLPLEYPNKTMCLPWALELRFSGTLRPDTGNVLGVSAVSKILHYLGEEDWQGMGWHDAILKLSVDLKWANVSYIKIVYPDGFGGEWSDAGLITYFPLRITGTHALFHPDWTDDQNERQFGKCIRLHGHLFRLNFRFEGGINHPPSWLNVLLSELNYSHLNDWFPLRGSIATCEGMLPALWDWIASHASGLEPRCVGVEILETPNNQFYFSPR